MEICGRNPVFQEKLMQFLKGMCELYADKLDPQDRYMAAWEAFLEACGSKPGTYDFWEFAFLHIRERLTEMQREQNRRWSLESPFSLNQPGPDGEGEALEWVNPGTGDFVNRVMFRDFLGRLPQKELGVALRYIQRCSEEEICETCRIQPRELRVIRRRLQRQLEAYELL